MSPEEQEGARAALTPRAVLLDIDGCVVSGIGREALPGAVETVESLRRRHPLRFVTNTTSRSRAWLAAALQRAGFALDPEEVVTPTSLARRVLTGRGDARGVLLADEANMGDLAWFQETDPAQARCVLVASESHGRMIGELGDAVRALLGGARLYTLQENRYFRRGGELVTDLGPVAAFLGYAARTRWENLGKPSPLLFETLAADLGCEISELVMVGDDAEFDVAGALRAGVGAGVLVRTGKYREGDEGRTDPLPTLVLESVADLPAVLP